MTDHLPEDVEALDDSDDLAAHPLTALRLEKHLEAIESGSYPYRFERSHLAAELHSEFGALEPASETDTVARVAGRMFNVRSMGKLTFAVLQDVSGTVQLFVDKRTVGDDAYDDFNSLDLGDWIGVEGLVMTSKKGELSVRVRSFELLAKSLRPFPDKWHGLADKGRRFRQRYLDLATNEEARQTALARTSIVRTIRDEFHKRGYVEVETPILQAQAGGAAARPFITHHNALGIDMYLRIATELHLKRLIVGGLEKVFEVGRIFRNEGIDATHSPEFTMVEAYEAFADYTDIMTLMEELFEAIAIGLNGISTIEVAGRTVDLAGPYRRVSVIDLVNEALGRAVGFDMDLDDLRSIAAEKGVDVQPSWGHGKLIYGLFEELCEGDLIEPTFVIDHPVEISPLTRVHRSDPNLAERFELYIGGSEMCDAFSELNDPIDQRARFAAQAQARAAGDDEAQLIDEDFLTALEYGMPPTGGLGFGVDRLVMLLTGQDSIREVVLFPQMRPND